MSENPYPPPYSYAPPPPASEPDHKGLAIASLVVGILGICAWIIPLCGFPMSIASLILGFFGLKSSSKGLAIAGLVLGGIVLILSTINAIAGLVMGITGGFDPSQFNFQ